MEYRMLGKTGLRVSVIGLGCEGFVGRDAAYTQAFFDRAIEAGVNCMDLYSPDPDMLRRVGAALQGRRQDFILQAHLCALWQQDQYKRTRDMDEVRAAFAALLDNLGTD
jgi:aryl-alcohol dehydrogenase-like predicted oxidoreductase